MCKGDEEASNALLGFISSLHENYDKALGRQKHEDEQKLEAETTRKTSSVPDMQ